ncbi:hypothetical protein Gohar_000725 [Gossypium harknessii]|uniref:Uncharacterized protein n=1 Tax=Gossypium harknessii TaxID=34285 RepID=A0A7J9I1K5_9ROSI|nr:hypothetical protein [Gossypium harknessii]
MSQDQRIVLRISLQRKH